MPAAKPKLLDLRHWEPNPVVVKELRQAVRSRAVTGMLLFFLVVLFIAMVIVLVNESVDFAQDTQAGAEIFTVFVVLLAIASILFIPLYVGIRMAGERQENNADLLYISTLSPTRIILGKFLCGAYVILLFFSACMPFMAFTNLLRGIDLPTVFLILAFLFCGVCVANMLAIFIACLPVSRTFKILLGLAQLVLCFYLLVGAVVASSEMMRFGAGSMMVGVRFWETVATVASIVAMAGGLLFVLSVALISPPSANRALPVRVYVTVIWLLGGLLAAYWAWRNTDASIIFQWCDVCTGMLIGALVVTVSSKDQLSLRVRRKIPRSRPLRSLAFLFYNGAAGGLIWVALLLILTLVASIEFYLQFADITARSSQDFSTVQEVYPPMAAYALAYALTGLFIHRTFMPRRRPALAGVFAVSIVTLAVIGPTMVLFFLNDLTWRNMQLLQLGNVSNLFSLLSSQQRMEHLYFASGWAAIAIVINARWFLKQVNDFRPIGKPQPQAAILPATPQ
jgi:hypothetical protein